MVKLIQGNFDQHNKSEPYIKARSGMRGMISGVRGVASNIMEGFGAMVGATAKESDPEEDSCPDDASYERNNRRRSNVSETGKKRGSIVMPREGQVGSRDLHKDTSDDEEKSSRSSAMSGLSDHTRRRGDTQSASGVSPSSGCPSRLYPDLSDGRRVSERDARREDDKGPSAARDHKTKSYAAAAQDGATRLAWNDDPNRVARKASGAAAAKGDTSEKDNECPICMDKLTNPKVLPNCKHKFCKGCIEKSFTHKQECPVCRMVYGKIQGTQPKNGRMETNVIPGSLPGYPCQTIVIQYNFPGGTQTAEHPHPGQPYSGAHRTAYLPDNTDGHRILRLLRKAFEQRLIFTVGRSVTTGANNCVTWNDIHHKTSQDGGPDNYGYPDQGYLTRVEEDLAAKGIK
ncbi:hypothetical protein NP493_393g04015 [Ridgeia piscesae]|uniref:E3 ubiquitin-protein ligase n=1 Tax=Ridgeia piscesae TaxID=27915 RepID=A0AAD9L1Z8_RIDPI|nr:hypothetical protein NP493_393g04015 [Ridgeia piscesae]